MAARPEPAPAPAKGRVGLVATRYGAGVIGGAEALLTDLGRGLAARGWEVDVLASAARDLYTWANELPVGVFQEEGLTVRRFPTVVDKTDLRRREWVGRKISMGWETSLDEQYLWMNGGPRVPGLFEYLMDSHQEYRALILAPYMFWTTFACSEVAPERSLLLPCLHDEPAAYLDIYKPMFTGVRGVLFNTDPERDLAAGIFGPLPRTSVIGSGIHPPERYDAEGFRRRHGLEGDVVFFAGRREWGKGWLDLLQMLEFANSRLRNPVTLLTCGVGEIGAVPSNVRVVDLGFVTDDERSDAMAAATVYLQPSRMESFSRTIMEAWLAETPVLADGGSAVVSWHCRRSEAGFTYSDRYDFFEALRVLIEEPDLARSMASKGRDYVLANYRWDDVIDRAEGVVEEWL